MSSPWRRATSRPARPRSARPSSCSCAGFRQIAISFWPRDSRRRSSIFSICSFTPDEIAYLRTLPQFAQHAARIFRHARRPALHRRPVRGPRRHAVVRGRAVPHAARAHDRGADSGNLSALDDRLSIHDRHQGRARGEGGAGARRGRVRHAARAFAGGGRARRTRGLHRRMRRHQQRGNRKTFRRPRVRDLRALLGHVVRARDRGVPRASKAAGRKHGLPDRQLRHARRRAPRRRAGTSTVGRAPG